LTGPAGFCVLGSLVTEWGDKTLDQEFIYLGEWFKIWWVGLHFIFGRGGRGMEIAIQKTLETVGTLPGQGGLLDQFDKRLRKVQRRVMFELFESINPEEVERVPVVLYRAVLMDGNRMPALLRFYLPTWQGYDEVFWHALGDYAILTLHRVKDLEYNAARGRIKIEYFVRKSGGRIRSQAEIRGIIQKIAFLIDNETLPTDFTHFRSMAERRSHIGELSKVEAAEIFTDMRREISLTRMPTTVAHPMVRYVNCRG
jgi:hypothetical protein